VTDFEGKTKETAARAAAEMLTVQSDEIHACWNRIGVYGNGSCAELQSFVHCRNCPVYSEAGTQLLDRALPQKYREEWTEHFARPKHLAPSGRISAVIFRVSSEWLGLPSEVFQEVAEHRLIHSLPHRRQGIVLGLANIRGELLICVSLARLFSMEQVAPREHLRTVYARLLAVNWDGQRLVFPVDEVYGIHRFQPHELKEPPATLAKSGLSFTRGVLRWTGHSVGLLDPDLLFSSLNRSLT
jgi:chemotaxis-related protein WspD